MSEILHTPLHQLHLELGAKMVPFAGYSMPVQYPTGIIKEHLHARAQAGLFDVSHMGQILVRGEAGAQLLERLIPAEIQALPVGHQVYGLFTNEAGGILDDLMITRRSENELLLVVNAACKNQDLAHLQDSPLADTQVLPQFERGLLALQGPAAKAVMAELVPEATALLFMRGCWVQLEGVDCYVTRSGYTGEDGFEISCAAESLEQVARALLAHEAVLPIGLGARDSLRLEAGLCLYGHDINEAITPVEAGLSWAIAKSRREGGDKAGGFPGAGVILKQLKGGVPRKRVGLLVEGRAPVREGAELLDAKGKLTGKVTSGGFSPCLERPIAMGYVHSQDATAGTAVYAEVRGHQREMVVTKLPFVTQNYFRG